MQVQYFQNNFPPILGHTVTQTILSIFSNTSKLLSRSILKTVLVPLNRNVIPNAPMEGELPWRLFRMKFSTVQVKYEWINPTRDAVLISCEFSLFLSRIILLLATRVGVCHLRVDNVELHWGRRLPPEIWGRVQWVLRGFSAVETLYCLRLSM